MPGNISSRNPDIDSIFENPFVRTLLTSVLMAVFLVDMGLGLFEIFTSKVSPLPNAIVFLIFAVVFIAGLVFYEKQGVNPIGSLTGGAIAGLSFSFVLVSLVGGVQFALGGGISEIGWDQVTSAIAASMIISVVVLKFFSHKFQEFS